ncbi:hypothetical protein ABCY62_00385 [Acetivibrio clariflavus]
MMKHYPHEIPEGEQQRVAIAFANNPKLIFADEPTDSVESNKTCSTINLIKIKGLNSKNYQRN